MVALNVNYKPIILTLIIRWYYIDNLNLRFFRHLTTLLRPLIKSVQTFLKLCKEVFEETFEEIQTRV